MAIDPRTGLEVDEKGNTGDWQNDDPFSDTFSAEQVHGPSTGGQWGQGGTAAARQNSQFINQAAGLENAGAAAQSQYGQAADTARYRGDAASTRTAPTANYSAADLAAGRGLQARGGTENTLAALDAFAAGQGAGPSAAQAAAASAATQGAGQQLALARSGSGFGSNAANMGQAQSGLAQVTAGAANQAATTRAAEDAAAQQRRLAALNASLGGGLSQQGADLAAQGQAAGQAQFDVNTQLAQGQQNDAFALGNYQLGQGFNQLGEQTNLGLQGISTDRRQLGQNALNSQADYQLQEEQMRIDAAKANQSADLEKDAANAGMFSSLLAGVGLSDERAKELEQRERALASALGAAELDTVGNAPAYSYKYKNPNQPGAAPGRQVSSMAQDLERGELGDRVVMETPQGKMVNYQEVMKMTPGAITELNRKVEALEAALGRRAA